MRPSSPESNPPLLYLRLCPSSNFFGASFSLPSSTLHFAQSHLNMATRASTRPRVPSAKATPAKATSTATPKATPKGATKVAGAKGGKTGVNKPPAYVCCSLYYSVCDLTSCVHSTKGGRGRSTRQKPLTYVLLCVHILLLTFCSPEQVPSDVDEEVEETPEVKTPRCVLVISFTIHVSFCVLRGKNGKGRGKKVREER